MSEKIKNTIAVVAVSKALLLREPPTKIYIDGNDICLSHGV